jgi:hypothetical protein
MNVIYRITYPNGKIYIGQDRTDDINYFGSADSHTIAQDFNEEQRLDFTIRKEILARIENISVKELNALERDFILQFDAAYSDLGYNRTHQRARQHCRTLWSEPS